MVPFSGGAALLKNFIDAFQLDSSQCAFEFREPVVVTDFTLVEPALAIPALVPQPPNCRRVCEVANQYRAAFARCDLLVGVEAKHGEIAKSADAPAVQLCPDGLAGIFDEHESMSIGDGPKRFHIGVAGRAEQ